jgi:hypothetical protein
MLEEMKLLQERELPPVRKLSRQQYGIIQLEYRTLSIDKSADGMGIESNLSK